MRVSDRQKVDIPPALDAYACRKEADESRQEHPGPHTAESEDQSLPPIGLRSKGHFRPALRCHRIRLSDRGRMEHGLGPNEGGSIQRDARGEMREARASLANHLRKARPFVVDVLWVSSGFLVAAIDMAVRDRRRCPHRRHGQPTTVGTRSLRRGMLAVIPLFRKSFVRTAIGPPPDTQRVRRMSASSRRGQKLPGASKT